jgi:hypothetical protein
MNSLDREISDVMNLLGLLVVFVVGYFSAVVPSADEAWGRPTPDVAFDRSTLANRLRAHRNLLVGIMVLITAVLTIVGPISIRTIRAIFVSYSILRAGVILVDVLLLAMWVACLVVAIRLERRRRNLLKG